MSESNLRHWHVLGKTDPAQTKPFRRQGGFAGTAIKPIWTEYRLTERFGPCGVGWGCDEPIFSLVPAGDELMVYCTLRCWYLEEGKPASLYGVGGDKVLVKRQSGFATDDEAYKKAFTDAMGNAFKHLGAAADVHMGRFDDSKYVNEMRREFGDEAPPKAASAPKSAATPETDPFAPATDDEARLNEARNAFARIKKVLNAQRLPAQIDDVIEIEKRDGKLDLIKQVHPTSYEALLDLAQARKAELRSAA